MPSTTPPAPKRRRAPQRYVPNLGSVDAAAEIMDCHRRTVLRKINAGELKAYRVGRHLKVDLNEVLDQLQPVPPESVAC